MKKVFSSALLLCILFVATTVTAQQNYHRCSTAEHLQEQLLADPGLADRMHDIERETETFVHEGGTEGSRAVVTIPVVVHVVYNTAAQNISDALILAQINQLNLDYAKLNSDASSVPSAFAAVAANTSVQFCLAQRDPSNNPTTGIVRKSTTVTSFSTNDAVKKAANGGDAAWDATKYLNLWVCNLGGGLLGYAQFPGGSATTDGVVVLYSSVGSMTTPGTAAPYNFGRTATHEVGHWLNLYHIWGDDGTACTGTDNVGDTPNQAGENYGCPAFPTTDGCSASSPGVMFMNYMDYTNDGCMNMFTSGQSTRMNALFATGGSRVGLLTSLGCQAPVAGACNVTAGLNVTSVSTTTATLNWAAVSGAASYNVQYRAVGAATWNSANTTAVSYAISGLTQGTNYEFQVQTVCTSASAAFSASATFTTSVPSTCTDIYESNNTSSTAKTPALNANLTGFITPSTDVDWFKFTTTTSGGIKIKVDLTNLPADYDVVLYKSNASTKIATGANGGTTSESIKYNATTTGTYYVKVYGYNGATSATSCYTLKVSTSSTSFRTGDNTDLITAEAIAEPVLKLFPNPASDKLNVEYLSAVAGAAKLSAYNLNGQRVLFAEGEATEGLNSQTLNTNTLSNGVYIFEVNTNGETQRMKFTIAK